MRIDSQWIDFVKSLPAVVFLFISFSEQQTITGHQYASSCAADTERCRSSDAHIVIEVVIAQPEVFSVFIVVST